MLELAGALTAPVRSFSLRSGTILAPLDDVWVAHSDLNHRSHVLNEECAAMLLCLAGRDAADERQVCAHLAAEFDEDPAALHELITPFWDTLVDLGLLIEHTDPPRD